MGPFRAGLPSRRDGPDLHRAPCLAHSRRASSAPLVLLGLAAGFIGVGILVGPALSAPPVGGSQHAGLGMLILLLGSLLWSIGSLYSRRARNNASPFLSSAQTMLCGGGLMIIAGLAHGEARSFDSAR